MIAIALGVPLFSAHRHIERNNQKTINADALLSKNITISECTQQELETTNTFIILNSKALFNNLEPPKTIILFCQKLYSSFISLLHDVKIF